MAFEHRNANGVPNTKEAEPLSKYIGMIAQLSSSDSSVNSWYKEKSKWGIQGDQTGDEANLKSWGDGRGSGGFSHVMRMRDKKIAKDIAKYMLAIVTNGWVGYNQGTIRTAYTNRMSTLRLMVGNNKHLNYDEWYDNEFSYYYGEKGVVHPSKMLNLSEVDLRDLSPDDIDQACGADCSSSSHLAFILATNLWRHYTYTPCTKSYNRFYNTHPSYSYCASGGGWQMWKTWNVICAGKETEPVPYGFAALYNGGNSVNKKAYWPCDSLYVEKVKIPEDVDRLRELGYDIPLHGVKYKGTSMEDKTDFDTANLYYDYLYIHHVGFIPGRHDRQLVYPAWNNRNYFKGYSGYAARDINGNPIYQSLYCYGVGEQIIERLYTDDNGTVYKIEKLEYDIDTDELVVVDTTEYGTGRATINAEDSPEDPPEDDDVVINTRIRVRYEPCMDQFIPDVDGRTLLKANYDEDGALESWGEDTWVSSLRCKSFTNPIAWVFDTPEDRWFYDNNKGEDRNGKKVYLSNVISDIEIVKLGYWPRRASSAFKTDHSKLGDWDFISERDTSQYYYISPGYDSQNHRWSVDTSGTITNKSGLFSNKSGLKFNYDSGNYYKTLSRYCVPTTNYDNSGCAGNSSSYYVKTIGLTPIGGSTSDKIWFYFVSNNNRQYPDYISGTKCWVKISNIPSNTEAKRNDTMFPFFDVESVSISRTNRTFIYNGRTYEFPETISKYSLDNPNGYIYYKDKFYTTGRIYFAWTKKENVEGQLTKFKLFVQDWKYQITQGEPIVDENGNVLYDGVIQEDTDSSDAERDPTSDNSKMWYQLKSDNSWEELAQGPFADTWSADSSDGENYDDADPEERPLYSTLLPVISNPINLESGDIILTRSGIERTAASSGGHMIVFI